MLANRLEESAISVLRCCAKQRFRRTFFNTRILVSKPELCSLEAIADVSQDASIGLKLATETRIERFHPWGLRRSRRKIRCRH